MKARSDVQKGAAGAPEPSTAPITYPYTRRIPGASDFLGCKPVPIKREDIEDYDGRFEYWTAENETAWMVREPTGAVHEQPGQRIARLGEVIAGVRGSPIECFGSMDLELHNERGERWWIMQADQAVYLYPQEARLPVYGMVIGEHTIPDIVLEVDHTTDVRRHKLKLYEEWGFPEVWVEVPDRDPQYGPRRGRRPGLSIHLLGDDGRYRIVGESRAFAGWTAEEIHTAMNEPKLSAATAEVLNRVGEVLGERDGTASEDTPWLRIRLEAAGRKAHTRGRWEGHAEGLREGYSHGRNETMAAVLRRLLASRGIFWRGFDAEEFEGVPTAALIDAALNCEDESDLLQRLRVLEQ